MGSGEGSDMPGGRKFSLKTSLSIFGVVILVGGIFATVMAAQHSTEQRSRAYDGGYSGGNYNSGSYNGGYSDGNSYNGGGYDSGGYHDGGSNDGYNNGSNYSTGTTTTGDIIIDNPAASVVGSWATGTSASGHYGSDYRYSSPGTGSYLQYTPNLPKAGQYDIYEWHSQGTNRTTTGKVVVSHSGGSQFISINQQINGGKWNLLGRFNFTQGSSGNVRITNGFTASADTVIIADAVKFVFVGAATVPTPTKALTYIPTPTRALPTNFPTAIHLPTSGPTTPQPTDTPELTLAPEPTDKPEPTETPEPTEAPEPTEMPEEPTPTPEPGDTILSLSVGLHGIGTAGDINALSVGNLRPLRNKRQVTIAVYDAHNDLVSKQEHTVIFDRPSGVFEGSINMGPLDTGAYTISVKTPQYLSALTPDVQYITGGDVNTLDPMVLTGGDINSDNNINIIDYNILMDCYSDLTPAIACVGNNASLADLTDDGRVNQFDYNLFLRELSNNERQ
jgi:hypothetical protein